MRRLIPVPAPMDSIQALLLRLGLNRYYTPELLADVRHLLLEYPPQAVARCLEQACDQLVQEGQAPDFPDNGQMDAYLDLLEGLRTLGKNSHFTYISAAA